MEDPTKDEFWLLEVILKSDPAVLAHIEKRAESEGIDLIGAAVSWVLEILERDDRRA